MVWINEVQIERSGHVLEITFEDAGLKENVRANFQAVNTQYGEYYMFVIANEGYKEKKGLFIQAILKILPQIQDYLIAETGCDLSKILMDHRSQLIHT